jgi:TolB-like protein
VSVPLMVGGTAKTPGNYTITPGAIVIKAGKRRAAITVEVTDNGVNEDDKTVVVSMGVPTHASQGKTTTSTMTIMDNDPEPSVTFTIANQQMKKNAGTAKIGVELSAVSGWDVIVPLMVGGTAKTPGNYTITPGPIVIKAGERSAAITVEVTDNGVTEDDKTVVVSMGVPTHGVQGKTTTSTVTIVDTHPVPTVSFGSANSSGEEKAGPARIEVKLSAASGRPVTVEYAASGGTAIQGQDYALQEGPLTFDPGETAKEIMVDIKNHGIYDVDKTLELALKNPKNAVLGSSVVHVYTIISNHSKPTVAIRSANQRLRKSAGRADITVQLSEVSEKDVIVPFTVGGTANQGTDFVITPSPVVIKAGKRSAEIAITMKDNIPVEAEKTIEVKLLNPDNAFLGSSGLYRLVMVKDTAPTIAVIPFFNASTKKNAGDIVMLQFVKELRKLDNFVVIEPGVVRQQFLTMRVIMYEGISSSDIDLIASNINADLILTGKVMDYQDDIALYSKPKVDFSVMLIDRSSKKIIWASRSRNTGNDAVTLFDWGSVNSANVMVSEMVRVLRKRVLTW